MRLNWVSWMHILHAMYALTPCTVAAATLLWGLCAISTAVISRKLSLSVEGLRCDRKHASRAPYASYTLPAALYGGGGDKWAVSPLGDTIHSGLIGRHSMLFLATCALRVSAGALRVSTVDKGLGHSMWWSRPVARLCLDQLIAVPSGTVLHCLSRRVVFAATLVTSLCLS